MNKGVDTQGAPTEPEILFTTFVRGNPNPTNSVRMDLLFDPSVGFHDYRIEWSPGRVRFLVKEDIDGGEWKEMAEFTTGVPRHAMYVMSNTWWPTWLPGCPKEDPDCKDPPPPTPLTQDEMHIIDRIIY